VGGLGFIVPSVVAIIALSVLFLGPSPPDWVRGAGGGAGAAVPAVAVAAGIGLIGPSRRRAVTSGRGTPWFLYLVAGVVSGAFAGSYLVLVLIACGVVELLARRRSSARVASLGWLGVPATVTVGGVGALAWVALKVGALSFGGGFVIVPLMQHDAVHTYHWMTATDFLSAVALGQVTPGPVVATVAAVGYAARGVGGGVLAATIAFLPSFLLVLGGAGSFQRLRTSGPAQAFLGGAGPAAIGAILGAAIPLAGGLHEAWQWVLLGVAAASLLILRRNIVLTIVAAGVSGAVLALLGVPLPV
jgi:chromate transporter